MRQVTAIWVSAFLALVVPFAILYGLESHFQKICLTGLHCQFYGLEKFQRLAVCGFLSVTTILAVFNVLNRRCLLEFNKAVVLAAEAAGILLGLISNSFVSTYPGMPGVAFSWIFTSAAVGYISLLIVKHITKE